MNKWKVLSWLLLVASISSIICDVIQGMIGTLFIITSVFKILLLIPYFGFAYQKKIPILLLWKVTFILQAIVLVISVAFLVIGQLSYVAGVDDMAGVGDIFVGLLEIITFLFIAFLLLIPPYLYAFKSSPLWLKNV